MAAEVFVNCKGCGKRFGRLEYMTNKECENPNCTCPEVAKMRDAANNAINKAKESSQTYFTHQKRGTLPTGYNENTNQYMFEVPDVLVVDVIVPKKHFGRRRKEK